MAVPADSQNPPASRWLSRIFWPNPPTIWQCAIALLAFALAAERFATSLFYSHFGVTPEEVGFSYTNSLLGGVVSFVGLVGLLNVVVIFPSLLILGDAWMDIQAYLACSGSRRDHSPEQRWDTSSTGWPCSSLCPFSSC